MTYVTRHLMAVTCTASGATYTQHIIGGFLHAIRYTPATASAFASGATCTISIAPLATGPSHDVLTFTGTSAAAMLYPRRESHTSAGATGGTSGQLIPIADEFIRLTVASGGASGQGRFEFYVQGR